MKALQLKVVAEWSFCVDDGFLMLQCLGRITPLPYQCVSVDIFEQIISINSTHKSALSLYYLSRKLHTDLEDKL